MELGNMKHTFFLAPAGSGVGLTTVTLGLVSALDRRGIRVAFFKPISQVSEGEPRPDLSTQFIRKTTTLTPANPIPLVTATKTISGQGIDQLMALVIDAYDASTGSADVVVVEGLLPAKDDSYLGVVNNEVIRTLNAQLILVSSCAGKTVEQLDGQIEYVANAFGGIEKVLGVIVNRYPDADHQSATTRIECPGSESRIFSRGQVRLIGVVPENAELTYCRTIDVQRHLKAEITSSGEITQRRVKKTYLLARTVPNCLFTFTPGALLVTPFPDLNTGNTTYKAVQRSANVISIGPMSQGLKRPLPGSARE
jgi:phosphate acetyltransferase